MAAKNFATNDVIFFTTSLPFDVLFTEEGQLEHSVFGERWQALDASKQVTKKVRSPAACVGHTLPSPVSLTPPRRNTSWSISVATTRP